MIDKEQEDNQIILQSDILDEAKRVGFFILPPKIDDFLRYINMYDNVYDFWKEHLRNWYQDEIHVAQNYIMLTGAIGTGKSTVSKISALYTLTRLLCLKDLSYFKLAITKPIQFVFFHVKMEKSRAEFVEFLLDTINYSDFFKYLIKERKKAKIPSMPFSFVTDGVKSNNAIGGDVIFYVFSEANFVNEDMILYKIDQAYKRFKSRFVLAQEYLGQIIIDTSASYEGAVTDYLLEKDTFYFVRAAQWEVKQFAYFRRGSFYVFIGDGEVPPHIVEEEGLNRYDKTKIIKVPKELEKEFRSDIYDALISLAGLPIRAPNALFNSDIVQAAFLLPNPFKDIENVNELYRIAHALIQMLDKNKVYFIHIDTAIRGDYAGIAVACWHDENTIEVPFAIGLHNDKKDIPMHVIEDFITILSQNIPIHSVTADSYQSYKLLQDISRKTNIETKVISTDKTTEVYFTLKKAIIDKKIILCRNMHLLTELNNLKIVQRGTSIKIDHAVNSSKDIADAVACAYYNCLKTSADKSKNVVQTFDLQKEIDNYKAHLFRNKSMSYFNPFPPLHL